MSKFLVLLACALCLVQVLTGAEIRGEELWLEVSLASGTNLELRQSGPIRVTDSSGIYSRELSGNLNISLDSHNAVSLYGIIGEVVQNDINAEESYYTREAFIWRDSSLVINQERLALAYDSFHSQSEAQAFADDNGISRSRIVALPMSGASLEVRDSGGSLYYFESPLTVHSSNPIRLDSSGLTWTGEFQIKVVGDRLQMNHIISLENYLAGVIQNEIGSGAPTEALKAQAVASRSHAVSMLLYNRHRNDGYDLCNGTHCQVYKGEHLLNNQILEAVLDTQGEILCYGGRVVDATYHSSCGGKTDASHLIWRGQPTPYLQGVSCIDSADSLDLENEADLRNWINTNTIDSEMSSWERASQSWSRSIRAGTLASRAGLNYVNRIEIISRGPSGRILNLKLIGNQTKTYNSESQIRSVFGALPSSLFYIEGNYRRLSSGSISISIGSNLRLKGKGSGHGVGMCQVGTLRRARAGELYSDILELYYPGTSLRTDWLNHERR
ncbi:MAG: SpoIID/LytB domain-containing protein [Candidatus Cloacimonadota bacterium]